MEKIKDRLVQILEKEKELREDLDSFSLNYKKKAVMKWSLYEIEIQIEKCLKILE